MSDWRKAIGYLPLVEGATTAVDLIALSREKPNLKSRRRFALTLRLVRKLDTARQSARRARWAAKLRRNSCNGLTILLGQFGEEAQILRDAKAACRDSARLWKLTAKRNRMKCISLAQMLDQSEARCEELHDEVVMLRGVVRRMRNEVDWLRKEAR